MDFSGGGAAPSPAVEERLRASGAARVLAAQRSFEGAGEVVVGREAAAHGEGHAPSSGVGFVHQRAVAQRGERGERVGVGRVVVEVVGRGALRGGESSEELAPS